MVQRIVFKEWGLSQGGTDRYGRAALKHEMVGSEPVVGFSPKHRARGIRSNPKTGKTENSWAEPDKVYAPRNGYLFHRGKCDEVRIMPAGAVAKLDGIDAERKRLYQELRALDVRQQDILAVAYRDGEPVTKEILTNTVKA